MTGVIKRMRQFEGMYPQVNSPIYLDPLSVVIGNVELGDHVNIWPNAVIRGDPYAIRIGAWTSIQDNCVVHSEFEHITTIGACCVIGHGAIIHGCSIEDGCLVGMGSIIMNGACIGEGCLIGAGTLITEGKTFPPNCLIIGSPGKVVRELKKEEIAGIREAAMKYWDKAVEHMVEIM